MKSALRAAVLFLLTTGMACPEAQDLASAYGFTSLRPPSNLFITGAVITWEPGPKGELDVGTIKVVCGPRSSLGARYIPSASHTVSQSLRKQSKSSWFVRGSAFDNLTAAAHMTDVESINVTLDRARILQLSDAELLDSIGDRTEECKKAIMARISSGFNLTIVSSALVADLTTTVKFKKDAKLDKKARYRQLSNLSAAMGGGHQSISESVITSRGLAIGIKTDTFLLDLGNIDERQAAPTRSEGEDYSMPMRFADADDEPDAPVVVPAKSIASPIFE